MRTKSKQTVLALAGIALAALSVAVVITAGRAEGGPGGQPQTATPVRPLSESDVLELLQGDVPPERVAEVARTHGITFEVNSAAEKELREAGGTDDLLKTLRAIAPQPEPVNAAGPASTAPFRNAEPKPMHGNAQQGAAVPRHVAAGEFYKNVQVLKEIPAVQLVPSMQFISASLGVGCEYCHVRDAFEKDDKEKKKTARKMIEMTLAINKENFEGRREVTCNSCHHGAAEPAAIPVISEEEPRFERRGPNAGGANPAAGPPLPTADELLAKCAQAVGGADAYQKITSRVEKGTITAFGGQHFSIEVFAKAPDKRLSIMHMPNGESITAFDGQAGWLGGMGRPPRAMFGAQIEAARLDADFYLPVRAKQEFDKFRVGRPEKVGEREAYLVVALKEGQPQVRLYFDEESGLLVRLVHYAPTPLGLVPTQIEYADYRDVDGVKIPFRWTLARAPGGRFTIQVEQVRQNVPIDDAKFAMPPRPAVAQKVASP